MFTLIIIIVIIAAVIAAVRMMAPSTGGAEVVTSFTAEPHFICRPGAITLRWNWTGDSATITSTPRVAETLGTVARSSAATVHVTNPGVTQFDLAITRRGVRTLEHAIAEVEMVRINVPITIGGQARCANFQGADVMQKIDSRPATEWSSDFKVHRIDYPSGTTQFYDVFHDNVLVLSGPRLTTNDLGGVALNGEWRFQRPLQSPDECNPNSPGWRYWPTFTIEATVTCGM